MAPYRCYLKRKALASTPTIKFYFPSAWGRADNDWIFIFHSFPFNIMKYDCVPVPCNIKSRKELDLCVDVHAQSKRNPAITKQQIALTSQIPTEKQHTMTIYFKVIVCRRIQYRIGTFHMSSFHYLHSAVASSSLRSLSPNVEIFSEPECTI